MHAKLKFYIPLCLFAITGMAAISSSAGARESFAFRAACHCYLHLSSDSGPRYFGHSIGQGDSAESAFLRAQAACRAKNRNPEVNLLEMRTLECRLLDRNEQLEEELGPRGFYEER